VAVAWVLADQLMPAANKHGKNAVLIAAVAGHKMEISQAAAA